MVHNRTMTSSAIEDKIRARLPLVRFMQVYSPLPLSVMCRLLKKSTARAQLPPDITREHMTADGVVCDWLIPANRTGDGVLLYLHGGGFVYPQTPNHLKMGSVLARLTGLATLMVDYRVAPAHPFPAPMDDCVTAYRWLLKQGINANKIVIAGDSAGGNLTLSTLMTLRNNGEPLPAAAACLSPSADLSGENRANDGREDPLLHPKARKRYRDAFVGDNDPNNPLISPLKGDWHGLPPLLIHAGEDEVLREDALRIEVLARAAGVAVQLETYPRMWHVFQLYLELSQSQDSLSKIADFLCTHINK